MLPVIFGLSGLELTRDEIAFFRSVDPLGYILFSRNIQSKAQVRALTDSLRELSGREDLPILIDQEGGRVARLKPPEWRVWPAGEVFARGYCIDPDKARRAAQLNYKALGLELMEVGITVNCAPLLDVVQSNTHKVIGDRAFGCDPMVVADLGQVALNGLAEGGVVGVIKHMPGHGRAMVDSHKDLPEVTALQEALDIDFAPFISLAHAPMAMTAHILYTALDHQYCATLSPTIIRSIIREHIGFDGLLMTDDLDMQALRGSVSNLAHSAIEAGCDVALNCSGRLDDMRAIAMKLPEAFPDCRCRLARAMAGVQLFDEDAHIGERIEMLVSERGDLLAALSKA